jgi:hypothetical protein
MRNLLSYRKAQFFILSAFAIATILYFVSKWIQPAAIIDTSEIGLMEEPFIFNNIVEKAIETIRSSKSCEELQYNLDEYKIFVENFARERGKWAFYYQIFSPCQLPTGEEIPTLIELNLTLISPKLNISRAMHETWTPRS